MIKKALVDSDVVLDVATGRTPFVGKSRDVLASIENGQVIGCISSNSVTNIYYILRKLGSGKKAKAFLAELLKYLFVLPVTHAMIIEALSLEFADFEDAVQHQCACSNQCDCIITRNSRDCRNSKIEVYAPEEFLVLIYGV